MQQYSTSNDSLCETTPSAQPQPKTDQQLRFSGQNPDTEI